MSAGFEEHLGSLQRRARRIAMVGAAGLAIGLLFGVRQVLASYLVAWLFVLGLGLGSLGLTLLAGLTGGAWGRAIRPQLEAGMRTLPFLALGFLPIAFGIPVIYPWSDAETVATDPILQHKAAYLNVGFYLVRAVFYFAVWIGLSRWVLVHAERHRRTRDPRPLRRVRSICGPGLVAYVLTMTFAALDWGMSLEPHWYSSMYGLIYVVGQVLSVLCMAVLTGAIGLHYEPFKSWLEPKHFHDLGNLLLAFVMLWAYISFSQYLIIWSGNLPEETPFYLHRTHHGWQALALLLALLHFAVPFVVLLSRRTKRHAANLAQLALVLLVMRYLDIYWNIIPAFHKEGLHVSIFDVAAAMALVGAWAALFGHLFRTPEFSPLQPPRALHRPIFEGHHSSQGHDGAEEAPSA